MLKRFVAIVPIIVSFVLMASLQACSDDTTDNRQYVPANRQQRKESLEKANRYMVLKEKEDIVNYIERHNLKVEWVGTNLCYSIVKQGDEERIKRGDLVSMEYEVRFLNGDLVYSSKESGPKTFVVGRGGVESGLEETIVYLHKNDVAVIIIPSDLAHGLIGDGNRIPPKTPIVYKVKIIENESIK